jgi:fibronectin type 3 domain-containing protein
MSIEKPRNPFILNFCEALIEKRGVELSEEKKEKEIDRMYNLYETMLGRRMVEALPDDKKAKYMQITRDLDQLSFEKIGEIFAEGVPDPEAVMKETLEEFSDIYLKNR